jgi:hypothetical protein
MNYRGYLFLIAWLFLSQAQADTDSPVVHKVLLTPRLSMGNTGILPVQPIDDAAWIWHPAFSDPSPPPPNAEYFASGWHQPVLLRFRREFAATASTLRIHVSADERFELFLDGQRIARGPDRSDVEHWCYATVADESPPRSAGLEHRALRAGCAVDVAGWFYPQGRG